MTRSLIRKNMVVFAGNKQLKIFGMLACASGKTMKRENRVFFNSEKEAKLHGYRPCGNCLRGKYKEWKNGIV